MISIFRAFYRGASFALLTVGLYTVYLSGRGVLLLFNKDATRWRITLVRYWARSIAALLNLDIHQKGSPPAPPFMLVSNHLSYIDIIPFFIAMDCVFVAKSEIRAWPVMGAMAEGINVIFIDRRMKRDIPRVIQLIRQNINNQQGVILFPEGTTTEGEAVKTFNSSLLKYAASNDFPVSYASIRYCTSDLKKPAHNWVCWGGDQSFMDHFKKLLMIPSIRAVITYGDKRVRHSDRKTLARKLQTQVEMQFSATKRTR